MRLKKVSLIASAFVLALGASLLAFPVKPATAVGNTCEWTGATDNDFSTVGNWTNCGGVAPNGGDNLIFDAADLSQDEELNNDITDLEVGNITIGLDADYEFTLSGNEITMDGVISTTGADSHGAVFNLPIVLSDDLLITAPAFGLRFAELASIDTAGHNLTIEGAPSCGVNFNGSIQGNGNIIVNVTSSGVSFTGASDDFTGNASVDDGQLVIAPDSNWNSVGLVTVNDGGALRLVGSTSPVEYPFDLSLEGEGVSQFIPTLSITNSSGYCSGAPGEVEPVTLSGTVTLMSDVTFSGAGDLLITGQLIANDGNEFIVADDSEGTVIIVDDEGNGVGVPDTGFTLLQSNPLLVLGGTLVAALGLVVVARKLYAKN